MARKVLLERLACEFADKLRPGQVVTAYDLQEYCRNQHKNLGIPTVACSRQLRLCPTLKPIEDNGRVRKYVKIEDTRRW